MDEDSSMIKRDLRVQLPYMIVFPIVLIILGYYLPRIYTQYFDKTSYYVISSPKEIVENDYKACDIIQVYYRRRSLIEGNAVETRELIRIEEGTTVEIETQQYPLNIEIGEEHLQTAYVLPCELRKGTYLYRGSVRYDINGVPKIHSWYTESFEIK